MSDNSPELQQRAWESGDLFKQSAYFEQAEPTIDFLWKLYVQDTIEGVDFTSTLDFAAGHGRNSTKLLPLAGTLTIVDINPECIAACRARFGDDPRITYMVNDGVTLADVPDDSITFLYSFDSMVHFDSDVVRAYLSEFYRVLKPGGRAFIHHSNYTDNPTGNFLHSPHWRNFMSQPLFAHYASRAGLTIVRQRVIDWGLQLDDAWKVIKVDYPSLDCLSLVEKPLHAPKRPRPVTPPPSPMPVHARSMPLPATDGLIGLLRYGYHVLVPLSLRLRLRDLRLQLLNK